jgi:hypothetical protein
MNRGTKRRGRKRARSGQNTMAKVRMMKAVKKTIVHFIESIRGIFAIEQGNGQGNTQGEQSGDPPHENEQTGLETHVCGFLSEVGGCVQRFQNCSQAKRQISTPPMKTEA